jgi:hypothetical protein
VAFSFTFRLIVMPGFMPGIHATCDSPIAWMLGPSPSMTVLRQKRHAFSGTFASRTHFQVAVSASRGT